MNFKIKSTVIEWKTNIFLNLQCSFRQKSTKCFSQFRIHQIKETRLPCHVRHVCNELSECMWVVNAWINTSFRIIIIHRNTLQNKYDLGRNESRNISFRVTAYTAAWRLTNCMRSCCQYLFKKYQYRIKNLYCTNIENSCDRL